MGSIASSFLFIISPDCSRCFAASRNPPAKSHIPALRASCSFSLVLLGSELLYKSGLLPLLRRMAGTYT